MNVMENSYKREKAYEMSMRGHDAFDREDYEEAFRCWTTALKMDDSYEGSGAAQTNIGYLYENGYGVEKDEQEAVEWYEKAAENGNIYGLRNLAHCYYDGVGMEADYEEAYDLYQQLAEDTEPSDDAEWEEVYYAQFMLGFMCENGQGVEADMDDALFWYTTAAMNGQENAEARLVELEQDSMGDLYKSANKYYEGEDEDQDLDIAFALYQRIGENCVAKNNTELAQIAYAQYSLGWMYEFGEGTEANMRKARYWYQKSADNGNEDSANRLAEIDRNDKARKSAESLSVKAKMDLDFTDRKQMELAKELLLVAQGLCDDYNGSAYDQWVIGSICENNGEEGEAMEWYMKSADQFFSMAEYTLGGIYYHGRNGVDVDFGKAFSWFERAAKQDHIEAQFNLALMYINGEGVRQDEQKGVEWLRKAAVNGSEDAQEILKANGLTY